MKVAYVEKQHREVKIFSQLRECGGGCTNKTLSFQVGVLHSVYYLIFFFISFSFLTFFAVPGHLYNYSLEDLYQSLGSLFVCLMLGAKRCLLFIGT